MQIQKDLVLRLLSGEPSSPLLLEGHDFSYMSSFLRSEVKTAASEPLILLGGQEACTMDEIRDLISRLHKKGHARRYVLLERTHKFRKDTSNALLKLLEEPPRDTHIILTALPYATISTIRSRCSIIKFMTLSTNVVSGNETEPSLADQFHEVSKNVGEASLVLLESFIAMARKSLMTESSPERAIKKSLVIQNALNILQKGIYSKVSLQNIFVMWNYA